MIAPDPDGTGPYYIRLADALEAAIADGRLAQAARLPPQRILAYDLGVTVGTVGRAYALLRARGLVSGEIGRGTFVTARHEASVPASVPADFAGTRVIEAPVGKLRFDSTAAPDLGRGDALGALFRAVAAEHPQAVTTYSRVHPEHWLRAGAAWLSRNGWHAAPGDVVPTHGGHAAALAAIAAMTATGDRVVFEKLTYSQLARSARLVGRRIATVEIDSDGMVPEDFARVCAQQHPKMAFLMPTAQNPTLATMPESRRREIARIARDHEVWLIEDEVYGAMADDPTPLLAAFAPERTFVVGGLSKSVAAGLRAGWIAAPPHLSQRLKVSHKMLTGGLSFVLAEAAAQLVLSGEASALRQDALAEIGDRQRVARGVFAGCDFETHPNIPYLWLKLPEAWLSGTFRAAALAEDLLIDDEDEYKPVRHERIYHRVRVAFSSSPREALDDGLLRLRRLLDSGVAGYDSDT